MSTSGPRHGGGEKADPKVKSQNHNQPCAHASDIDDDDDDDGEDDDDAVTHRSLRREQRSMSLSPMIAARHDACHVPTLLMVRAVEGG